MPTDCRWPPGLRARVCDLGPAALTLQWAGDPSHLKNATPIACRAPRAPKMQPLLHFEATGAEECNPYCIARPHELQKCNPYCILASSNSNNATPISLWAPRAPKMQPLLQFGVSGARRMQPLLNFGPLELHKCNPYCILGHPFLSYTLNFRPPWPTDCRWPSGLRPRLCG